MRLETDDRVAFWSDVHLTEIGMKAWQDTYGAGGDDDEAYAYANKIAKLWAADKPTDEELRSYGAGNTRDKRARVVASFIYFASKWAVHAFQRITTSHTYGAALMCSDVDRDSLETIETQWHAFMVLVPDGLLKVEGEKLEYNRVLVTISEDGTALLILLDHNNDHSARILCEGAKNLADLLASEDNNPRLAVLAGSPTLRALTLAKRLVAGLLLAMQHADNFKSKTYPAREKRREGRLTKEPAHRVVFVGKPISVDCRRVVADYISGRSAKQGPPSVQALVRGHYRRQVIGIGRSGRKVIWVQPYWRGPDDAPIFTHPKRVGGEA